MIRYYLESCCGFAEYKAKLDIKKVRKEFDRMVSISDKYLTRRPTIFTTLVTYALECGKERTDISSNASDYDPYLTEIYVSQEDYDILKNEFQSEDFSEIKIE